MLINNPETIAQLQKAFAQYEQALVSNDVPTLDRLFWNSPHTLRYGAGENLYGFDAIQAFRNSRPAKNLDRTVLRTAITTLAPTTAWPTWSSAGQAASASDGSRRPGYASPMAGRSLPRM